MADDHICFYVHGKAVLIDKENKSLVNHNWLDNGLGYLRCRSGVYENRLIHRVIMCPTDEQEVDHMNGDKYDNRKCNLRVCTHAENMMNRRKHKNNRSGIKGVYYAPNRAKNWRAQIRKDGVKYDLGGYETPGEAKIAYEIASKELHKNFRRNSKANKIKLTE